MNFRILQTQMKNVEKEVQQKVYEFYKKERHELQKKFQKCKSELFRSTNGAEAYKAWNKVKEEMIRSEYKIQRIKNNKLDKLKEENKKLDTQDLRPSYTQNKKNSEIGKIRTERAKLRTKRKLRQVKEREKKIKNRKRRHKQKQRLMDIFKTKLRRPKKEIMDKSSHRTEQITNGRKQTSSYVTRFRNFVPTLERRNLDNKITEFVEFSRKRRLAVYFDRRGRSNEVSYEGEECLETDYNGEGLWKQTSCFTLVEGDNEALD